MANEPAPNVEGDLLRQSEDVARMVRSLLAQLPYPQPDILKRHFADQKITTIAHAVGLSRVQARRELEEGLETLPALISPSERKLFLQYLKDLRAGDSAFNRPGSKRNRNINPIS